MYASDHRQTGAAPVHIRLSDFGLRHLTAKSFFRPLLNPDPAYRLTADQALVHTWLTSFAVSTEDDLSGLPENFDLHARWRSVISTARALSRFANHKGANHQRQLAISSDEEDGGGGGESTSWRAGLEHQETTTITTTGAAAAAALVTAIADDQQSQNLCGGRKEWGNPPRPS